MYLTFLAWHKVATALIGCFRKVLCRFRRMAAFDRKPAIRTTSGSNSRRPESARLDARPTSSIRSTLAHTANFLLEDHERCVFRLRGRRNEHAAPDCAL